jgi:hypothetical protein
MAALDSVIGLPRGPPPLSILDCSCGIGTQAIGLAPRATTSIALADYRALETLSAGTFEGDPIQEAMWLDQRAKGSGPCARTP